MALSSKFVLPGIPTRPFIPTANSFLLERHLEITLLLLLNVLCFVLIASLAACYFHVHFLVKKTFFGRALAKATSKSLAIATNLYKLALLLSFVNLFLCCTSLVLYCKLFFSSKNGPLWLKSSISESIGGLLTHSVIPKNDSFAMVFTFLFFFLFIVQACYLKSIFRALNKTNTPRKRVWFSSLNCFYVSCFFLFFGLKKTSGMLLKSFSTASTHAIPSVFIAGFAVVISSLSTFFIFKNMNSYEE